MIRESAMQDKYNIIIANIPDAYAYHKILLNKYGEPVDYVILEINDSFENLTGMKREAVVGRRFSELLPTIWATKNNWLSVCGRVALTGESENYEYFAESKNRWYSLSFFSYETGYFATIFKDYTELKMAQHELKDKNKYARLFNNSIDLYCITDFQGVFHELNYSLEKLLGFKKEELKNKKFLDFVHPDDIEATSKMSDQLIDGKNVVNFKNRYLCKNGSYKWLEWNSFPITSQGLVYSSARDVTERETTINNFKKLTHDYEIVFNNTQTAFFLVNVENNDTFRFVRTNSTHEKMTGLKIKEIMGRTPVEVLGEEIGSLMVDNYRRCAIKKSVLEYDETLILPVGKRTWHTMLYPVIENGRVIHIVGSGKDLTEQMEVRELQRKAEEKLKLLNESIEYENLKSEFFANLSHELRTPLNVIFATLQTMGLYGRVEDKQIHVEKMQRYLKIMNQNCFRLLRLVNNLIDITKIDAGYFQIHPENKNIVSVVEDITLSVAEYVENKKIELIFDTEVEEKIMAIDSDKIERILLNLLSNSVKFTEEGGFITVNLYERENEFFISVKDTGIGIPEDKLDVIFDRFRQIDKSLTKNHEGSGIGLALVKSLVEMHGGTVSVKSTYGKGSEFIISLPVKVLNEEKNCSIEEKNMNRNSVERINIEFSDIYS